jgi:hypothetical protein
MFCNSIEGDKLLKLITGFNPNKISGPDEMVRDIGVMVAERLSPRYT